MTTVLVDLVELATAERRELTAECATDRRMRSPLAHTDNVKLQRFRVDIVRPCELCRAVVLRRRRHVKEYGRKRFTRRDNVRGVDAVADVGDDVLARLELAVDNFVDNQRADHARPFLERVSGFVAHGATANLCALVGEMSTAHLVRSLVLVDGVLHFPYDLALELALGRVLDILVPDEVAGILARERICGLDRAIDAVIDRVGDTGQERVGEPRNIIAPNEDSHSYAHTRSSISTSVKSPHSPPRRTSRTRIARPLIASSCVGSICESYGKSGRIGATSTTTPSRAIGPPRRPDTSSLQRSRSISTRVMTRPPYPSSTGTMPSRTYSSAKSLSSSLPRAAWNFGVIRSAAFMA